MADPGYYLLLALIDGLNICSLSLLALFISFMFIRNTSRRKVAAIGALYIAGVFTAYFTTGLGAVLFSITLPTVPHLLARIGITIMIFIGAANIINYFYRDLIPTMIPNSLGDRAIKYMKATTIPSITFSGMLAGLHNFPCACTGGIYMIFLSIIAEYPNKIPYLLVYNLLFILPLISILYISSSKLIILKYRRWQQNNAERTKLLIGIIMVSLGITLLFTIVLNIAV